MNELGRSLENYLEAILIIKNKRGIVYSVDVAKYLKFSKPSVSNAVKRLKEKECLLIDTDGALILTNKGQEIAENVYERHQFLKSSFINIGVSASQAEYDACLIEHDISEESYQKLKVALQNKK